MKGELNDTAPGPFSESRGDHGSLRSQGLAEAAWGRPGGQP